MKNTILKSLLLLLLFNGVLIGGLHADKYAGEITRFGLGVRNTALGNTGLTDVNSPALAYWNAALLAESVGSTSDFELFHSEEFSGLVTYDSFLATWGKKDRYSLILMRIGIDDIPLTRLPDPDAEPSVDNQPYKYKTVNNSDYLAYFGFYRKLSSYVIGITPKVLYRNLANTNGYGFGADVSTYLKVTNNALFALKVRDFFSTQIFWANGTREMILPSIDTEFSYSFPTPIINTTSRIILGVDLYLEGRILSSTNNFGVVSTDYHFGLELPMPEYLTLYLGYDVKDFTSGLTLYLGQFQINYGFKHNTELDNSHRVSIGLKL
ncbi:MAG: hypothetical protein WCX83_02730 [Candidatus Cloacimonas sp.]|jgi:hypothetical protein|nr:hypothetical protein [Candidatus Cloacimonadota bacterium]